MFYTFSVSDEQFFWRYSESKTDRCYPVYLGNIDQPIKVIPSVNKVATIIVYK